jgi:RES domain-containing protein
VSAGRFHRRGKAPALYFAKSPVVALLEVGALAKAQDGALVTVSRPPQMLVSANITIPAGILDLMDPARRRELKTNLQELTGLWILEPYPSTQRLGQSAYDSDRIVAIRYPSSLGQQLEPNLVVFVDKLVAHPGARLEANDPNGDLPKTVRPLVGP